MSEINGREVNVGDRILVGTQVANVTFYNEDADKFGYVISDGGGVNNFSPHISNTPFEIIENLGGLAATQADLLDTQLEDVKTIADPQMEDADTDRVKGEPGAKLNGVPESNDEVTK